MNIKLNITMSHHKRSLEVSPPEIHLLRVRGKSSRPRPNNPILYKALRKVWIRSGKSVDTNRVSCLQKGSVVTINRINGRSGRVVVQQQNGEYTKIGWVTLYTHDKLQLLEKFNLTIAPKVRNRSLTLQTTSIVDCTE